MRIVGVHVLNAPRIFWPIYKLCMKILPEKIRKRIQIHSSLKSLHDHIDKSILPKYLGGLLEDEEALDREMINELVQADKSYDGRSNLFKYYMISIFNLKCYEYYCFQTIGTVTIPRNRVEC
jgi:hypothetical protein